MSKKQSRNEFRKHKPSGHPKYIYEKDGDEFRFLGITHSDTSKGCANIQLEQNPEPNSADPRPSYVETKSETDKQRNFRRVLKGWKFGDKDKEAVKEIIRKDRQNKTKK